MNPNQLLPLATATLAILAGSYLMASDPKPGLLGSGSHRAGSSPQTYGTGEQWTPGRPYAGHIAPGGKIELKVPSNECGLEHISFEVTPERVLSLTIKHDDGSVSQQLFEGKPNSWSEIPGDFMANYRRLHDHHTVLECAHVAADEEGFSVLLEVVIAAEKGRRMGPSPLKSEFLAEHLAKFACVPFAQQ